MFFFLENGNDFFYHGSILKLIQKVFYDAFIIAYALQIKNILCPIDYYTGR